MSNYYSIGIQMAYNRDTYQSCRKCGKKTKWVKCPAAMARETPIGPSAAINATLAINARTACETNSIRSWRMHARRVGPAVGPSSR